MAISPGFTPVGNDYHPLCCARNTRNVTDPIFLFFFSVRIQTVAGKNLQNLFGNVSIFPSHELPAGLDDRHAAAESANGRYP